MVDYFVEWLMLFIIISGQIIYSKFIWICRDPLKWKVINGEKNAALITFNVEILASGWWFWVLFIMKSDTRDFGDPETLTVKFSAGLYASIEE